jgi:hypothetical protein
MKMHNKNKKKRQLEAPMSLIEVQQKKHNAETNSERAKPVKSERNRILIYSEGEKAK